jgi:putative copper resistance protein D
MTPIGANALAQWPIVAAQAILFGTSAFEVALAPRDPRARSPLVRELAPFWIGLAAVLLLAAPFALLTEVSAMAAAPWRAALAYVPEVLRETHGGRLWIVRLIAIAAIAVVAFRFVNHDRAPAALCAMAAILMLAGAFASHADDWGGAMVAVNFLHQAAAGVWAGALLALCYGEFFGDRDPAAHWIHEVARRVSAASGWAVGVLFATGAVLTLRALGCDSSRLLYSAYGRALILKIAVFAAVVAIGGYNRYRLMPNVHDLPSRRTLVRLVAVECVFILGVFGLAAILANTPPAH